MSFTSMTDSVDLTTTLNDGQSAAVLSDSKRIVCAAGAGTGKTHTLLARLQRLVRDCDVDPDSILVLTFTRAAAQEFELRWNKVSPDLGLPYFGTFHAFCYSLICTDENIMHHLGYNEPPLPLSEYDEAKMWECAEIVSGVKLPKRCHSVAYKPTRREKFDYEVLVKTMKKLMVKENRITFDSMCFEISKLFSSKDPIVSDYFKQYTQIFVDEFQDTDPIQSDFIESFEDASIFVVGDVSQSIYGFRGADPTVMRSYLSSDKWSYYPLYENYRSTQEICDYANTVSDPEFPLKLEAHRHGDPVMKLDGNYMFGSLNEWRASIDGSAAIIARTNKEVSSICDALDAAGIEYSAKHDKQEKIQEFLAALNDENLKEYLLNHMDIDVRYRILRETYLTKKEPTLADLILEAPEAYYRIQDIKQTLEFKQFKAKYLIGEDPEVRDPGSGIYVGTIHSVKGLEFDDVFVYGTQPDADGFSNDEERNIHYVACTRAKNRLILVTPTRKDIKWLDMLVD